MQFYAEPQNIQGNTAKLLSDEAHHIKAVLRKSVGDVVELFDGKGKRYQGKIGSISDRAVSIENLNILEIEESTIEIHLGQALTKGSKMDFVVEKATELGVSAIHPFTTSRVVPHLDSAKESARLKRWQRIALEASKQCLRATLPLILPIVSFEELLQKTDEDIVGARCNVPLQKIILWENAQKESLKSILKGNIYRKFFILVGPEGGFSIAEVELAKSYKFQPASLGKNILRTETAGLAILSIIQYENGR